MPPLLRSRLIELFGPAVDDVRVVEFSLVNLLHCRPLAVTRRRRIYLRGDAATFYADPELVLHEYFHVLRQWETGDLGVARYLLACCRHGYWNNPYEIDARRFAARFRHWLARPAEDA